MAEEPRAPRRSTRLNPSFLSGSRAGLHSSSSSERSQSPGVGSDSGDVSETIGELAAESAGAFSPLPPAPTPVFQSARASEEPAGGADGAGRVTSALEVLETMNTAELEQFFDQLRQLGLPISVPPGASSPEPGARAVGMGPPREPGVEPPLPPVVDGVGGYAAGRGAMGSSSYPSTRGAAAPSGGAAARVGGAPYAPPLVPPGYSWVAAACMLGDDPS